MKAITCRLGLSASLVLLGLVALSGCHREATKTKETKETKETPKVELAKSSPSKPPEKKKHDHSGWWCDEHGVPESECSMCSNKVAAECKKKGDWCEKHERAKSQCFICEPGLEAKYAARFEAKYGEKPPVPEENRAKPDDKK